MGVIEGVPYVAHAFKWRVERERCDCGIEEPLPAIDAVRKYEDLPTARSVRGGGLLNLGRRSSMDSGFVPHGELWPLVWASVRECHPSERG
jgi:hypothetical protein